MTETTKMSMLLGILNLTSKSTTPKSSLEMFGLKETWENKIKGAGYVIALLRLLF